MGPAISPTHMAALVAVEFAGIRCSHASYEAVHRSPCLLSYTVAAQDTYVRLIGAFLYTLEQADWVAGTIHWRFICITLTGYSIDPTGSESRHESSTNHFQSKGKQEGTPRGRLRTEPRLFLLANKILISPRNRGG